MSIRVMTWVWDHSRSRKSDRLVLLAIADCASDDGGNAYPSMTELIRKTGLSERGVQGCIGKLTGIGELAVYRNAGPGGCNRYRVLMKTPAGSAPPAGNAGGQEVRGVQKVRGQEVHPPAGTAGPPPQELRDPPAGTAPGTVLEPSLEPSVVLIGASAPKTNRGTRIPADFTVTPEMVEWARTHTPGVDGRRETAAFIDYWRGMPGQRGVKTDWPATWRNWMRRAGDSRRPTAGNRSTGANRHINGRDDNPFRNGANATIASQQTRSA